MFHGISQPSCDVHSNPRCFGGDDSLGSISHARWNCGLMARNLTDRRGPIALRARSAMSQYYLMPSRRGMSALAVRF